MVISSSNSYPKSNTDVIKLNPTNKINLKRFKQNGQIQIYQSSFRGSYSSIIAAFLKQSLMIDE